MNLNCKLTHNFKTSDCGKSDKSNLNVDAGNANTTKLTFTRFVSSQQQLSNHSDKMSPRPGDTPWRFVLGFLLCLHRHRTQQNQKLPQ